MHLYHEQIHYEKEILKKDMVRCTDCAHTLHLYYRLFMGLYIDWNICTWVADDACNTRSMSLLIMFLECNRYASTSVFLVICKGKHFIYLTHLLWIHKSLIALDHILGTLMIRGIFE